LGFISLSQDHINGLFVQVGHQHQGIGRALINQAQGFDITDEKNNDRLPFDEYVMTWPS